MESFAKVLTRTAFSSSFQRYWVVLDGQNLTYYENFDFKSQSTINVKNSLSIRDTKIVALKDNENSTKFGVKIISARGLQLTLFDCESAEDREVWIKALNRASKMHDDINNELSLIRKYLTILNMNPADDKTISKQDIIQNYKKCARLLHPDKGGDLDKFKIINEAYSFLCTVYDDRETLKAGKVVDYEAIVEKAGDGIGLGIVVNEDQVKRQIVVKSVHNQIQLHGLSTEANGAILPGDILIAIDGDDCSDWFLSRIRARLSNSRVPLGAKVHFTFERLLVDRQTDVPSEIEWQDKTNSTQVLSADISTPKKFIRTENRVVDSDDDDDHDNDHQHHHPDTKQEDHTQLPQTTITSDNEKKILEMREQLTALQKEKETLLTANEKLSNLLAWMEKQLEEERNEAIAKSNSSIRTIESINHQVDKAKAEVEIHEQRVKSLIAIIRESAVSSVDQINGETETKLSAKLLSERMQELQVELTSIIIEKSQLLSILRYRQNSFQNDESTAEDLNEGNDSITQTIRNRRLKYKSIEEKAFDIEKALMAMIITQPK